MPRTRSVAVKVKPNPPSPDKLLISFDPGVSTGVAVRINGQYQTLVSRDASEVWGLILPTVDAVIFEDFAASVLDENGIFTIKMIGGIISRCMYHNVEYVRHTPQNRYPKIEEAKALLKQIGKSGYGQHEMDALAHLLVYEEIGR